MEKIAVVCHICWLPIGCQSHQEGTYYRGDPKAESFCSECNESKEACPQNAIGRDIFGAICTACDEIIKRFPREDQLIAV